MNTQMKNLADAIYEAACNRAKGRFSSIVYDKSVDLAAAYRKAGYAVRKTTSATVRFVNLSHTKAYKEWKKEQNEKIANGYVPQQRQNNNVWVYDDYIRENTNTGNVCLQCVPTKNKSKTTYTLTDPNGITREITRTDLVQYLTPSAAAATTKKPLKYDINITDIVSLNGVSF